MRWWTKHVHTVGYEIGLCRITLKTTTLTFRIRFIVWEWHLNMKCITRLTKWCMYPKPSQAKPTQARWNTMKFHQVHNIKSWTFTKSIEPFYTNHENKTTTTCSTINNKSISTRSNDILLWWQTRFMTSQHKKKRMFTLCESESK